MSQIEVRHVTHEYAAGDRRITAVQDVSFRYRSAPPPCARPTGEPPDDWRGGGMDEHVALPRSVRRLGVRR